MTSGMATGATLPMATMICVMSGRVAFMDLYMLSNMGTMVSSITATSARAMHSTTTG